jgi:hypothetical protein
MAKAMHDTPEPNIALIAKLIFDNFIALPLSWVIF